MAHAPPLLVYISELIYAVIAIENRLKHQYDAGQYRVKTEHGETVAVIDAHVEETWAGSRASFAANSPRIQLPPNCGKAIVEFVSLAGHLRANVELSLQAVRKSPNSYHMHTIAAHNFSGLVFHIQTYASDPSVSGEDLVPVGVAGARDAPFFAAPDDLIPQLPGPLNALRLVNDAVKGVSGSQLPEEFRTINGPLPPGPNAPPEVRRSWSGYMDTPLPAAEGVSALIVNVPVAPAEAGVPWHNDGDAAYVDAFGQDALTANLPNNTPVTPPEDPQRGDEIELHNMIRIMGLGFAQKAAQTGLRATHPTGVGALGGLMLERNHNIPNFKSFHHGLFDLSDLVKPRYLVALRHATLTLTDDAAQDARGCSFRLMDPSTKATVMDFAFNTGETCPFWTLDMVKDFAVAQSAANPAFTLREYLLKYPAAVGTLADNVRRAPSSFANLTYCSQSTYEATDSHDVEYLVRFRVIPYERRNEKANLFDRSMPDHDSQRRLWNLERAPDEMRSRDYLRKEFAAKFNKGTFERKVHPIRDHGGESSVSFQVLSTPNPGVVHYAFQLKFCLKSTDNEADNQQRYNMSNSWSDLQWHTFGTIHLTKLLGPLQTESLHFNIGKVAPEFRLPSARSSKQYTSVAVARSIVYGLAHGPRTGATPPRWESFASGSVCPFSLKGKPVIPTASPGYVGADYTVTLDREIPATLSGAGYVMLPDTAKYTTTQALFLSGPEGAKAKFAKNFLLGLHDQLYYGGGKSDSIVEQLRAAYAREGDLDAAAKSGGLFTELKLTPNLARTVEFWLEDDYEFARQRLGGLNPVLICNWTTFADDAAPALPADGAVPQSVFDKIAAAKAGNSLYVCDYRQLDEIVPAEHRIKDRFLAAAVALFGIDLKRNALVPLAISLLHPSGVWFTPPEDPTDQASCHYYSWLLAKMHVATADVLMHEFGTHLTLTHLVSESILIALYQAFPKRHPIFKLLRPHFDSLATIDFIGIRDLLAPGKVVDQIMSAGRIGAIDVMHASFNSWTLLGSCIDRDIHRRGVEALSNLSTGYPWSDDGLPLFKALKSFVADAVAAIYPDGANFADDAALAQFWKLLTHPEDPAKSGYPTLNHHSNRFPAFPGSQAELIDTLTAIMWTASAQHSAVNNGQVDFCAFVPNAPMLHRKPVPARAEDVDAQYVIDSLPSLSEALQQLGFMYILTNDKLLYTNTYIAGNHDGDENALYLEGLYGFSNPRTIDAVSKFNVNLLQVEKDTKARQHKRIVQFRTMFPEFSDRPCVPNTVEYPYLLPSHVNLSITN